VITATWTNTNNGRKLGDLRLTVGTVDTPPAGVVGEEPDDALSAQDISWIADMSLILLRDIDPSYPRGVFNFLDRGTQRSMKTEKGNVLWGTLFNADEVTALTNLAPESGSGPYDFPPQYLCLFIWKGHQWILQQFLGNAYGLELHYRKDHPSVFLQATRQTGRYDGDYLSWYYDDKTSRLVRTNFEDWGPFYLVGNYLCLTNGYERLAHDESHWIYAYKEGRKGALLASVNERDTGPFEIAFQDHKSGEMVTWSFNPHEDNGGPMSVCIATKVDPSGALNQGEITVTGEYSTGYFLDLLTGLNPKLLDDEWLGELPLRQPLQRIPIQATGSTEIVRRLQWPQTTSAASK
jgi:hypothetical protein